MLRLLKWIVILVVIAVAVALILTLTFVDTITKTAIEKGGAYALGVETTLEKASIGITSGEFALDGLVLANPQGYESPHFLRMGHAGMALSMRSLLSDTIRAPELVLDGFDLNVERAKGKANYDVILENLARFEAGEEAGEPQAAAEPEPAASPSEPSEKGTGKTFVLDRLVIRNVKAHFDVIPLAGDAARVEVPVPEIVVEDLGSEMSLGKLFSIIVKAVLSSAAQMGKGLVPDDLLQDLQGRLGSLEGVMVDLKGTLGGQLGTVTEKTLGAVEEKAGAVQEQIQEKVGGLKDKVEDLQEKVGGKAGKALEGVNESLKKAQEKLGGFFPGRNKKKKEPTPKPDHPGGG